MALKNLVKSTRFYKELRLFYRSVVIYRQGFSYFVHRFAANSQLRRLGWPLDRAPETDQYSIHLLCNHDGLDLLFWALGSWYKAVARSGQVYIHEDGSFRPRDRELVRKLFPYAKIVDRTWAAKQVDRWLAPYPAAREFRRRDARYIFALKLADPYFVSSAPAKLVLDIDVLWFSEPRELLDRLLVKKTPFMIKSHSPMDYRFADGQPLSAFQQFANGGIVGYRQEQYALPLLEEFIKRSGGNNPSRLVDQAAYVYILSHTPGFEFLSEQDYVIKPKSDNMTARHYTGPKREKFWFEGVKKLKSRVLNHDR